MHLLFIKSENVNDRINGRNTGPCVSIVMMIGKDLGYGFEVSVTSPSSCYRTSNRCCGKLYYYTWGQKKDRG